MKVVCIGACAAIAAALLLPSCGAAAPSSPAETPFDGERAYRSLQEIVALGPRVSGTEASAQTRAIIRRDLEAAGIEVKEHPFVAETPSGPRQMVNVVGVVKGTRPGVIVLGNHYDTKHFADFEFVGANDGGSTTAWMIEMARALGPTREGYSIWLCWFDGEEAFVKWSDKDGIYGSKAMVQRLKKDGQLPEVRAMINLDMIGDCDLGISKDRGAPAWMQEVVWETAREMGYGDQFGPIVESIQDDHTPFRRAGIDALELIDYRYGGGRAQHRMNWHTVRDRMDLVCAKSLKIVGDVILSALDPLEESLYEREMQEGGGGK